MEASFLFEDDELRGQPADRLVDEAADPIVLARLRETAAELSHLPARARLVLTLLLRAHAWGVQELDLAESITQAAAYAKGMSPPDRRQHILTTPPWPVPKARLVNALCLDVDLEEGERALLDEVRAGTVIKALPGKIKGKEKTTLTKQVEAGLREVAEALEPHGIGLFKVSPAQDWGEDGPRRSAPRFYLLATEGLLDEPEPLPPPPPPERARPRPPWLLPGLAGGALILALATLALWSRDLPREVEDDLAVLDARLDERLDEEDLEGAEALLLTFTEDTAGERWSDEARAEALIRHGARLDGVGAPEHRLDALVQAYQLTQRDDRQQRALAGLADALVDERRFDEARAVLDWLDEPPAGPRARVAISSWRLREAAALLGEDPRAEMLEALGKATPIEGPLLHGDLDGDGEAELLITGARGGRLVEPGPSLDGGQEVGLPALPLALHLLDLPGQDLVVLSSEEGHQLLRLEQGALEPASDPWQALPGGIGGIAVADIDDDGQLEAWVSGARGELVRLDRSAAGWWHPRPPLDVPGGAQDLGVTRAGGRDLLLAAGEGQLAALGHAEGGVDLTWRQRLPGSGVLEVGGESARVAVALESGLVLLDLDIPGAGGVDFTPSSMPPCQEQAIRPVILERGDLDGDGQVDLVAQLDGRTADGTDSYVWVLRQTPEGWASVLLPQAELLTVADVDGQGDEEVVVRRGGREHLVLGMGPALEPLPETAPPAAPPSAVDFTLSHDQEASRQAAEGLARVGLLSEAAGGLEALSRGLVDTGDRGATALRAAELYLAAGQPERALPLLEQAMREPQLATSARALLHEVHGQRMDLESAGLLGSVEEVSLSASDFDGQWRILSPLATQLRGSALGLHLVGESEALQLPLERTDGPLGLMAELDVDHLEAGAAVELAVVDEEGGVLVGMVLSGEATRGHLERNGLCVGMGLHEPHRRWSVEGARVSERVVGEVALLPGEGELRCRLEVDGATMLRGGRPLAATSESRRLHLRISSRGTRSGRLAEATLARLAVAGATLDRDSRTSLPGWVLGARLWRVDGDPVEGAEHLLREPSPALARVWGAVAWAEAGELERGARLLREVAPPPWKASSWGERDQPSRAHQAAADLVRVGEGGEVFRAAYGDAAWAWALHRDARMRAEPAHRDWTGSEVSANRALDVLASAQLPEEEHLALATRFYLLRGRARLGRQQGTAALQDLDRAALLATSEEDLARQLGLAEDRAWYRARRVEARTHSARAWARLGDEQRALDHALEAAQRAETPTQVVDELLSEPALLELMGQPSWAALRDLGSWHELPPLAVSRCLESDP